ncbi:hypothetical protein C2I19_17780 [Chromobacterium alticapitis]|uniref:Uncharacterized protein n=1 Tax=Chromobacterium alticapitis TaxID=2073169 RepID=A0A2S5DC81_9NEIS|nr:hypothetical protein C2I19_17780 [Chromobacterium alticapitis]
MASAVPVTVGWLLAVMPSVLLAPVSVAAVNPLTVGAIGALVSMVMDLAVDWPLTLPAASVAVARML